MNEATPVTVEDVPHLGPIRIRALRKHGFATALELKTASVDTLIAVPGITAIKAAYIQDFLKPFSAKELKEAASLAAAAVADTAIVQWEAHTSLVPISPIASEVARSLGAVARFLTLMHGIALRNRLLVSLERFSQECQAVITEGVSLRDSGAEKLLRRLRKASESLLESPRSDDFDKKTQGRFADLYLELAVELAQLRIDHAAAVQRERADAR